MIFNKKISNEHIQKVCSMMYTQIEKNMKSQGNAAYFSTYVGGEDNGFYPVGIIMLSGVTQKNFNAIDTYLKKVLSVTKMPMDTINPND